MGGEKLRAASGGLITFGASKTDQQLSMLVQRARTLSTETSVSRGHVGEGRCRKDDHHSGVGFGIRVPARRQGDRGRCQPDFGTLARRIPEQSTATVRALLADENLCRYTDVRRHTNQAASRLEVIASERNPAMSESFDANDYRQVIAILQSYYNIIITDCGTGVVNSAMEGVLGWPMPSSSLPHPPSMARKAPRPHWIGRAHGYQRLVGESVVVISAARPGGAAIDVNALTDHFLGRVRAVQVIPYDDHLATGSYIDLDQMDRRTRTAFLELAATVADSFGPIGPLSAPQGWSPNEQRRR